MNFSETSREIFQADEKTKLLTYIWTPKGAIRAVFIALHGGMAHAGDWVTPALYFMRKGIATYAPDLRWHGTYPQHNPGGKVMFHTESYEQYCRDVHNFHKWVRAKHPGVPVFVIAHSNGSLIALNYGLTLGRDADIRGFIVSSPWLKNMVEVSPVLLAMSKVLAKVTPMLAVAPEPLTDKLTHDREITARHHADEAAGLRGTKATVRLGAESMKTQEWVVDNMGAWRRFPLFAVVAGRDMLADPDVSEDSLKKVPPELLTYLRHEENYHENFNELNRDKTFDLIAKWVERLLTAKPKAAGTRPKPKKKVGSASKKGQSKGKSTAKATPKARPKTKAKKKKK